MSNSPFYPKTNVALWESSLGQLDYSRSLSLTLINKIMREQGMWTLILVVGVCFGKSLSARYSLFCTLVFPPFVRSGRNPLTSCEWLRVPLWLFVMRNAACNTNAQTQVPVCMRDFKMMSASISGLLALCRAPTRMTILKDLHFHWLNMCCLYIIPFCTPFLLCESAYSYSSVHIPFKRYCTPLAPSAFL